MIPRIWTFLCLAALTACSGLSDCGDQVLVEKISPDGQHVATLFVRDCGATTGYATQLAITKRGVPFDRTTVVFIADDDHGSALTQGPAIWTEMRWTNSTELFFAYAEKARIVRRRDQVDGIHVRYRATGPMALPSVF